MEKKELRTAMRYTEGINLDICSLHLEMKYCTDMFDDGEAIFRLLESGRFKNQRHLATFFGIGDSVVSELLQFYVGISIVDQRTLREKGKVTREECRKLLSTSET